MKKQYTAPTCKSFALSAGRLFTTPTSLPVSSEKADDGGWSRKFWGLTDKEEDEEKDFDWE